MVHRTTTKRNRGIVSAAIKAGDTLLESLETRQLLSTTVATPTFYVVKQAGTNRPNATAAPGGLSPATVRAAYGMNSVLINGGIVGDGAGQTIAIVDAFDAPNLLGDLTAFNNAFTLQQFNVAGGPTLTKLGQTGSATLPGTDPAGKGNSWAVETSLDVEWAHVIAPKANIIVYEANSASNANLFTAIDTARNRTGVSVVSMSFGSQEFSGDTANEFHFTTPNGHQGVTFIASSGDDGAYDPPPNATTLAVQYPAASLNVLAVGGTRLNVNGNVYVSESAWGNGTSSGTSGGAGGGLSTVFAEPARQRGIVSQTSTQRAVPDVGWLADPASGVPVYDSWDFPAATPWLTVGGTSLAAPMWAGLMGVVNQARVANGQATLDGAAASTGTLAKLYTLPASDFHDITTGNNGYAAGAGYDLVTGRGTPIPASIVRDLSSSNAAPVIGNFTATPSPASSGTPLTLTATGVQETGGTIARVSFYQETNGITSIQTTPGGDLLIGSITNSGSTTYSLSNVSTAGLAPGTYVYYAVAIDANGATVAAAAAVTITVAATPTPVVGGFSATPSPVTAGVPINLTATGVTETGGSIANVKFYEETNASTGLQTTAGGDTFLGSGVVNGTTYTLVNVPTTGWAAGVYTLYALVTDAGGRTVTATTTVTVNAPVIPGNDAFAGATTLTGTSVTTTGSTLAATKEAGEPSHAGNIGGHSIWWTWTAASSGKVTVTTAGSSFDTLLGAYTGTAVNALTTIASNDDAPGLLTSGVSFTAVAGKKYYFAVDGYNGASGNVTLNLSQSVATAQPSNDLFANGTVVSGATFAFSGTNVGATRQTGEPVLAGNPGGSSVWFSWTAPTTRTVTLTTAGSSFDTLLGVYTGSAVNALTFVASNDDASGGSLTSALTFRATAGVTYRFVIDGYNAASGNYVLNLS